jgi:RHS repeat-associated protein
VSGSDVAGVSYDNAGNDTYLKTYSARNLLTHVASGTDEMPNPGESSYLDYAYDGRGVRISTSLTTPGVPPSGGTKTRRSVYSPELHLLAQSDWASYSLEGEFDGTDYIWFADQPIAQLFTDPSHPARYTFTDHLGTPILQTDPAAAVVWRAEYQPYGSVYTYRAGDADDPQALRLPGQEASENDEYNIFRWYRSGWGRYTQADQIGLHGGISLFAYALENPTAFADPLGLKVRVCCKLIPAFALAGANHCFFQFDSGSPSTIGLHGTYSVSGFIMAGLGLDKGKVTPNAGFDTRRDIPATCGPWAGCNADNCVKNLAKHYPSPSRYFFLGPNSNTFASVVSQGCGVTPPNVAAPGW